MQSWRQEVSRPLSGHCYARLVAETRLSLSGSPDARRPAAAATGVWSLAFAVLHLYWAFGGRAGLGGAAAAADAALARPGFAIYNWTIVALSFVGVIVAVSAVRARAMPLAIPLTTLASAILLVRGTFGMMLLLLDPNADGEHPLLLVVIEPSFVVGGIAFGWLSYILRRARSQVVPQQT